MGSKKEQAINLRKEGRSYNEIGKKIGLSKSTLSYWLHNVSLSEKAKNRLNKRVYEKSVKALIKRNKAQTFEAEKRSKLIYKTACLQVKKIDKKQLFLIGTALYWGEGYKKGADGSSWKCVDFTNSDCDMVKVMMRFFREICLVNEKQFRIQVMVHKKEQVKEAVKYWSKITGVNKEQFIKTSYSVSSASKGKIKNILNYGTVHVRVYDVKLFYKIIGWIDGLKIQTTGCGSIG